MAPDETELPHYAYAAKMAVRSLHRNLWSWSRQERTRVILAALDALPVLPDGIEFIPGGKDWLELLTDQEHINGFADAFNDARLEAEIIMEEQKKHQRARARRHGV